jgi:hypothetical protein
MSVHITRRRIPHDSVTVFRAIYISRHTLTWRTQLFYPSLKDVITYDATRHSATLFTACISPFPNVYITSRVTFFIAFLSFHLPLF